MPDYHCIMIEDLPTIVRGKMGQDIDATIGRALTQKDGEAIVAELNRAGTEGLRDRVLTAVNDAIEEAFDA